MLRRRNFVAGLGAGLLLPAAARAAERKAETLRTERTVAPLKQTMIPETAQTLVGKVDPLDRLTLPVWLNGQGPFVFAVDTAAERSVIASEIASRLNLPPAREARMHGIGGAETCSTAAISELSLGKLRSSDLQTPVMPRARLEVDGLIGLDVLEDRCVRLDFTNHTLTVDRARPSMTTFAHPGEAIVRGMSRLGQLTFVDARVDGTLINAFIDSGADASVGNEALAEALHVRAAPGEQLVQLQGATGQTAMAYSGFARRFQLGGVNFNNLRIMFSDLHVFDHWGLRSKPAMLVGCDLLKLFAAVELDFGRRELRMQRADVQEMRLAAASRGVG